jgi:O-antigen/teichoic acid export membrane protein
MGAGRSIAVQNFNENLAILLMGFLYSFSTANGVSSLGAIAGFGGVVALAMYAIYRWHKSNLVRHHAEVDHLMEIARNDNLHG